MRVVVFEINNFKEVQEALGLRGEYRIDPYYLKRGHQGKPMFWVSDRKTWQFVHSGDKFFIEDDGSIRWEKLNDL